MQYAANLPNTRAMLAPVVALVIGAAGATGVYALVDDNSVSSTPDAIVISQPTTGPNEAGVATAVSRAQAQVQSAGKDESTTAAAVGSQAPSSSGPNEAGVAAAVGSQTPSSSVTGAAPIGFVIGGAH
jgi:hypothetical protein